MAGFFWRNTFPTKGNCPGPWIPCSPVLGNLAGLIAHAVGALLYIQDETFSSHCHISVTPLLQGNPALVPGHLCWWQADSPKLFPCGCWVAEIGTWSETGISLPKGWRCNSSMFWNISWTSKHGSADASAEATWVFLQAGRGIRGTTTVHSCQQHPALLPSPGKIWWESIRFGQSYTQVGFGSSFNGTGSLSEQRVRYNWLWLVMYPCTIFLFINSLVLGLVSKFKLMGINVLSMFENLNTY